MRIGSLCSGYGGLDAAVREVLGGELAFVADNDPDKSAILAYRFPGVPNLGDLEAVDWSAVEPVDVLTAGFPCTTFRAPGGGPGCGRATAAASGTTSPAPSPSCGRRWSSSRT